MRKKKRQAPPPPKPGKLYQHLIDVYKSPPNDGNLLKKGHVLYVYCSNGKSATQTVRAVCPLLPPGFTTDTNKIQQSGTNYHAFKKPSEPSEWSNFMQFSNEQFKGSEIDQSRRPSHLESSHPVLSSQPSSYVPPTPGSSYSTPSSQPSVRVTPSSSVSLRERNLTPKKKLKRRLKYVAQNSSDMKHKYKTRIKDLKAKLDQQRLTQIKYLNQDIKRKKMSMKSKDAQITKLRKQLANSNSGAMKKKLTNVERNHKPFKKARSSVRKVR